MLVQFESKYESVFEIVNFKKSSAIMTGNFSVFNLWNILLVDGKKFSLVLDRLLPNNQSAYQSIYATSTPKMNSIEGRWLCNEWTWRGCFWKTGIVLCNPTKRRFWRNQFALGVCRYQVIARLCGLCRKYYSWLTMSEIIVAWGLVVLCKMWLGLDNKKRVVGNHDCAKFWRWFQTIGCYGIRT